MWGAGGGGAGFCPETKKHRTTEPVLCSHHSVSTTGENGGWERVVREGRAEMWQGLHNGSPLCMVGSCPGHSGRPTLTVRTGPWRYPPSFPEQGGRAILGFPHLNPPRPWGTERTPGTRSTFPGGPGYRNVVGRSFSKCVLCGSSGEPVKRQVPQHLCRESASEGLA